jgi:hypothetical protein
MNPRIEELAAQCGFSSNPDVYDRNQAFDIPKFAELIIQDCVAAVTNAKCSQVSTTWDKSFAEYIKSCCTGAIHEVFHGTIV